MGLLLDSATNIRIDFQSPSHEEYFDRHGFRTFNDFWQLPNVFVDDVNIRKGGWSGASKLKLTQDNSQKLFFVKRQVNQSRYSMSKPLGSLTYKFELDAINRNIKLKLPASNIVSWGFHTEGSTKRAFLVSEAIEGYSIEDIRKENLDWDKYLPTIQLMGEQLYAMHQYRIQHGALYPDHMFLNLDTNQFRLIDFERSRVCFSSRTAIENDFRQFLRRAEGIPTEAIDLLLEPYQMQYRKLIEKLKSKHYFPKIEGINE
jgi:hypothetical protein